MTPLVTIADLAAYKYIADSVRNAAVWPQFVNEAQLLDVKCWLGDALLAELIAQAETDPATLTADNLTLLTGGSYTYQGRTYTFVGLKAVIIYFAFARYTSRAPYNFTAVGITVKDTDLSTPASDKAVQRLSTEAMLNAAALKDEVILYLRRNAAKYPLYRCTNTGGRPRTFFVIGD
jgi:hypothetical protein